MIRKIVAGAVGVAAAVVTDRTLGIFGINSILVTIAAMAVGVSAYMLLRMKQQ